MLIKILRSLLFSAGLTIIALLPVVTPFFGRTLLMHSSKPIQSMTLAVAILVIVLTLVGAVVLTFLTFDSLRNHLFVFGCAVVFPLCLSDLFLLAGRLHDIPKGRFMLFGVVACFLLLTWMRGANGILYRGLKRAAVVLFSGLGLWVAIILGQLLALSFWQPATLSSPTAHASVIYSTDQHGRVVWILFDELAFQQTYGHRDARLRLPHLDAFRQQSTLYTEVVPVGDSTEVVVPSLLLGQQLAKIRYRDDQRFDVVAAGDSVWRPYSASQTLLAEARALGYKSGIVGWYNPYCSLLVSQWDSCLWTGAADFRGMSADAGVFENLRSLMATYTFAVVAPQVSRRRRSTSDAKARLREYECLMEEGRKLLSQPGFDFVFIHLSVPHPPAFYDRRTKMFSPGGSYLDGLALADLALGDFLDEIESSSQWQQTSVVVCGDPSECSSTSQRGFGPWKMSASPMGFSSRDPL